MHLIGRKSSSYCAHNLLRTARRLSTLEQLTTYHRGMSDDNNSTAVTLTDSQGGGHDDAHERDHDGDDVDVPL